MTRSVRDRQFSVDDRLDDCLDTIRAIEMRIATASYVLATSSFTDDEQLRHACDMADAMCAELAGMEDRLCKIDRIYRARMRRFFGAMKGAEDGD